MNGSLLRKLQICYGKINNTYYIILHYIFHYIKQRTIIVKYYKKYKVMNYTKILRDLIVHAYHISLHALVVKVITRKLKPNTYC